MTYSRLANIRETRAVLERFGLATKHRLGQNFLVNDEVIGRIVELADLGRDDVVLEVGPGIGTLTVAMLARVRAVCSIEADRELESVLAETFASARRTCRPTAPCRCRTSSSPTCPTRWRPPSSCATSRSSPASSPRR